MDKFAANFLGWLFLVALAYMILRAIQANRKIDRDNRSKKP